MYAIFHALCIVKFCENLYGQASFFSDSFIPIILFSRLQVVYVFPSCISTVTNWFSKNQASITEFITPLYFYIFQLIYYLWFSSGKFSTSCWACPFLVYALCGGVHCGGPKLLHRRVKSPLMLVCLLPVALPSTRLYYTIGEVIFSLFVLTCRMF